MGGYGFRSQNIVAPAMAEEYTLVDDAMDIDLIDFRDPPSIDYTDDRQFFQGENRAAETQYSKEYREKILEEILAEQKIETPLEQDGHEVLSSKLVSTPKKKKKQSPSKSKKNSPSVPVRDDLGTVAPPQAYTAERTITLEVTERLYTSKINTTIQSQPKDASSIPQDHRYLSAPRVPGNPQPPALLPSSHITPSPVSLSVAEIFRQEQNLRGIDVASIQLPHIINPDAARISNPNGIWKEVHQFVKEIDLLNPGYEFREGHYQGLWSRAVQIYGASYLVQRNFCRTLQDTQPVIERAAKTLQGEQLHLLRRALKKKKKRQQEQAIALKRDSSLLFSTNPYERFSNMPALYSAKLIPTGPQNMHHRVNQDPTTTENTKRKSKPCNKEGSIVGGRAPEIGVENKGRAMLEKMGWHKGSGLGKDGNGMLVPPQVRVKTTRLGLI